MLVTPLPRISDRPIAAGPTIVSYDVERLFTNTPFHIVINNIMALYDALRLHANHHAIAFRFYTMELNCLHACCDWAACSLLGQCLTAVHTAAWNRGVKCE